MFDCKAITGIPKHKKKTQSPKSKPFVFVSYTEYSLAVRFYAPYKQIVFMSKYVKFPEKRFSDKVKEKGHNLLDAI